MQKGSTLILALVVIVVAVGAYYVGTQKGSKPTVSVAPATSPAQEVTDDWKTYNSPNNDFSFKYPDGWKVGYGNGLVSISCVSAYCESVDYNNFHDIYISNTVSLNTLDDYKGYLKGLGPSITEQTQVKFLGLDAITAAYPGSKQSGYSELKTFVVYKGRGYEFQYFYPKLGLERIRDFLGPNPNILSTFKFM